MGRRLPLFAAGAAVIAATAGVFAAAQADPKGLPPANTPIQHVVVVLGENESFDHYFGTYPDAANPVGQPTFIAKPGTPAANTVKNANLLAPNNPNSLQPQRLDRSQAVTCSNDHGYGAEQMAFHNGAMDRYVETTGRFCALVMNYYDG